MHDKGLDQPSGKSIGQILIDLGIRWSAAFESGVASDDFAPCVLCGQKGRIVEWLGKGEGICQKCARHWRLE